MSEPIFDVDEASFAERVLAASSRQLVLVDFWAEWCAPCLALGPNLERVVSGFDGQVLLAKLEVDDNMRVAGRYRIRGFPTVIFFRDGEEQERFAGNKPVPELQALISQHLQVRTD